MKDEAKILVVDDERGMCDSLKTLLGLEGYHVTATVDPLEAMELLKSDAFDLVITDIKMPRVSGPELLRFARQCDPHLEVILMTGYASLASAKQAVDEGAFSYLTKPVEFEELKIAISRSLEKRRTAIEKERLLAELSRANKLLEKQMAQQQALYFTAQILADKTDPSETLFSILSSAIDVTGAKIGSVMILDEATQELYIGAACGLSEEIMKNTRLKLGSSIAGYVASTGKPLIVEDIEKDPRFSRINRQHYETKSLISVPLKHGDKVLGVINLNNKTDGTPFDEDDLRLLTSFALHAAVAIERADIFARKEGEITALTVLHEIAQRISTVDSLDQVSGIIYHGLRRLLDIEAIFWYGISERLGLLQLEFFQMPDYLSAAFAPSAELKIEREVTGLGQSVDIDYVSEVLGRSFAPAAAAQGLVAEIIPVQLKRSASGAMVILARSPLGRQGKELAAVVASQAASVYERQKAILSGMRLVTMGKMIAEICHDLKKPLTNLKGTLQVYRHKLNTPDSESFFVSSEMELSRLQELVSELVESANPNKYYTKREPLKGLVDKAISLLQRELEKKEIAVSFQAEDVPDVEVNAKEILSAIVNLMLNAVESMSPKGRLGVTIKRSPTDGQYVRLEISDTGCGIPESDLPRIFDRYFTTKEGGSGLGLAIVEQVINAHNGRVTVESKVGVGTTFKIDLPIIRI